MVPIEKLKEQFLRDVKSLGLRFPVAEITKNTGWNKSNVSRYLSGETDPSVTFLKKFYEKYFPDRQDPLLLNEPIVPYLTTQEYINDLKKKLEDKDLIIKMLQEKLKKDELLIEELSSKVKAGGRRHSA